MTWKYYYNRDNAPFVAESYTGITPLGQGFGSGATIATTSQFYPTNPEPGAPAPLKGDIMEETKSRTIRDIPTDLWWAAKALAATRQISIRQLIIDLLTQAVKEG